MKHSFSKEILYHFNCGKCDKWWSIADYHLFSNSVPENEKKVPILITCPHCGHNEEIKEIENDEKRRLD
jgi:DNA-directed RNA polymerase subunit RPC12/RpoP